MASQYSDHTADLVVATHQTADEEPLFQSCFVLGDTTAFQSLWEQYKDTLFSRYSIRWMGNNEEDAKDALSSASLRAWQYLSTDTPHEITDLKAWFTRLLYNNCMTMQRVRQKRLQYTPLEANLETVANLSSGPSHVSTEDMILRDEMKMYIRSSINMLPPHLREPVILYFFQEMPQREIAMSLDISPENVRKRLQHARALLRQHIAPYVEGEYGPVWQESKSDNLATALLASVQDVVTHLPRGQETITSQVVAVRTVQLSLPDGVERHVYLVLDQKPARQLQKVETLRTYVQRHPTGWRKRVQLAHLLYVMGHWEEAIAAYRQVLQRQPRNLYVQLRLGQMLHVLYRDDEAITVYQDALALTDKKATQHYLLGCVAACRQELEESVQSFTAATLLEPHNVAHLQALGLTQLHADQPVAALQAFESALGVDSDDLVALTYSYSPLVAMGRDEEAQRRMERVLEIDPKNALALTQLIQSRCRMRRVHGEEGTHTKTLLHRATQVAADCPDVHAARAHYYIAQGKWQAGLACLQEYTVRHSFCPAGWHYYAHWCFRTGELQRAVAAIRQALTFKTHDAVLPQDACTILTSAGKYEEVRPLIEAMLQRFPDRWSVWATGGQMLVRQHGDKEYACSVSAHAPRLQPDLSQAWLQYGQVLALAGKHQDAITALKQGWERLPAGEENPFAAEVSTRLGACYQALGKTVQSHTWWEFTRQCARSLMPLNPPMGYYWLGKALAALGQKTDARQAYRTALDYQLLYPANREATAWIQQSSDRVESESTIFTPHSVVARKRGGCRTIVACSKA